MKGIFPLNHVELFPIESLHQEDESGRHDGVEHDIEGEAIVKYDFMPEKTFELQLRKVRATDHITSAENNGLHLGR